MVVGVIIPEGEGLSLPLLESTRLHKCECLVERMEAARNHVQDYRCASLPLPPHRNTRMWNPV